MKPRIHKKLCKKAAQSQNFVNCTLDDDGNLWHIGWYCGGEDNEYDHKPAWDHLIDIFEGSVNTMVDEDSECGTSWKPENQCVKPTPKNIFAWVVSQNKLKQINEIFIKSYIRVARGKIQSLTEQNTFIRFEKVTETEAILVFKNKKCKVCSFGSVHWL